MLTKGEIDRKIIDLEAEIKNLSELREELDKDDLQHAIELGNSLVGKCFKIKNEKTGTTMYIFAEEVTDTGHDWYDQTPYVSFKGLCITTAEDKMDYDFMNVVSANDILVFDYYLDAAEVVDADEIKKLLKNKLDNTLNRYIKTEKLHKQLKMVIDYHSCNKVQEDIINIKNSYRNNKDRAIIVEGVDQFGLERTIFLSDINKTVEDERETWKWEWEDPADENDDCHFGTITAYFI